MDNDKRIAEISKVLGVDTRIKIIRLLSERCLCVGELAEELGITAGAVSQHLRILRSAGAVLSEKRGYFVHYCLNENVLRSWQSEIISLFEPEEAAK
ncbi:ArsR/SmtB family transcription factor [Sedimentisphaera salicampi]|uniref:Transcriptional repressor SdpR n=1 Tax=Sedimentisphaera salicampi TaxID=1941349 RepID=A0A1W6LNE8_9BACT|nr:metalloregulator ArsR/SmtB family transcription factor [Sedimentisphaera salicampi]ARN57299.1 Transcriptional repressor SdpR [Sedimentisphaera salicampi]OXU14619.1 Transcriptional repressor SdpR [Sedimentisphaera salicampi]